jgi:hypothetical protein
VLSGLKTDIFNLPLTFIGGEQEKVTIPFDDFTLTKDKDFLTQTEDDERTEKFIYAYTDSGVSENGRNWTSEHMESMATQVVDKMPVGYLGHIKPTDYGYEFPEPQVVWFGSTTEENDDTTRLWIKGYLLPTATKLETWIKTKAVDSISVYGKISYKMKGDVMDIQTIDLKSIDIARKLGEGLNSGIVGLYGEMDATYEDVRCDIEKAMRKYIKENPVKAGFELVKRTIANPNPDPYVYCWIKKMFIDKNTAIINCEYGNQGYKFLEVAYEIDEDDNSVTINSIQEVVEKVSYTKKKDGVSATNLNIGGEMNSEKEVKNIMPNNFTIEDVMANKEIYSQLKTSIATEMATEQSQKVAIAKAGEMDKLINLLGGEQENIVERVTKALAFNTHFVGEMSSIFAGEGEVLEPEVIIEKTQEAVDTVKSVKEAVGVEDGEDVVEAVKEKVEAVEAIEAKEAIADVDSAFEEKIKTIKNETLAEFVRDDFADIIGLKAEDIDGDVEAWKTGSLKEIDDNFDAVVKKYQERLAKIAKSAKAVGEMNAFEDLGGNTSSKIVDTDEDPDIAEAKRLGYGI